MYRVYDFYGNPVQGGLFSEYRDAFMFKQVRGNSGWWIKQITFKQY